MATEAKEKLERFRARRRGHRGVCTKLEKEANELLLKEPQDDLVERIEVIAKQFEGKLTILSELDEEILNTCDVSEIQGEIEDSAEICDRILNTKRKLERFTKLAKNLVVTNGNNTIANMNSSNMHDGIYRTREYKRKFDKFNGEYNRKQRFNRKCKQSNDE